MAKLMHDALGYERYGVRGSDLGGVIVRQMALVHPEQVLGVHLTGIIGAAGGSPPYTAAEQKFIDAAAAIEPEIAYARLQMSKPQTLAHSLNDSPVGLAAWIVEKFRAWSDCGGEIERRFSKDQLLTNVMLYWVPEAANSSCRLYCETMRASKFPPTDFRVEVPTACAIFPREIIRPPRAWVEKLYNVARWTPMARGGHFAAMEEPGLLVEDVRAFFRTVR
jgi:pimeloyl-ACP methyl ester carboxylesterase